jgi:hypothetical protein
MGAPAAQPPPPPLNAPAEFNLTNTSSVAVAADADVQPDANLSAPVISEEESAQRFVPRSSGAQRVDTREFSLSSDATVAPLVSGAAPSARELLAQGAEVIDYDLTPVPAQPDQAAPASSPEMAATGEQPAASPSSASQPQIERSDSEQHASSDVATAATNQTQIQTKTETQAPAQRSLENSNAASDPARFASKKAAAKDSSEKIAAQAVSRALSGPSGVKSSIRAEENNFLSVDSEKLETDRGLVGTRTANWGISMNPESRSTPFPQRFPEGAVAAVGATLTGIQSSERSSETGAAHAPKAAEIVREIRDIADGLWAVERSSVEVRFNFSETERLSVKVEYRDGVVKTTFRTDSPELRDTLSREWQSQVASASESRPYRVADPVFNTPPADARGFSLGGDGSRQQRQADQAASAPNTFAATFGRGPSSASSVSSPAPASMARPDTALHLHAFA